MTSCKTSVIKVNAFFGSTYWSESGASTVKMLSQGTNTLPLSGCIKVATYEGMKRQYGIEFHTFVGTNYFPKQTQLTQKGIYWTKQWKAKPFIKCISYL